MAVPAPQLSDRGELYDKLKELSAKEHYLGVINSFASALLAANTVDETVWAIAKHAVARLGYADCVVYLVDPESGLLVQRAAHGPKNPIDLELYNPITLRVGEGIAGTVAETGIPEIVSDTSSDPRYVVDDDMRLSEIAVPLIAGQTLLGVIDSEHPNAGFYSQKDIEILTTIASMASTKLLQAIALEELAEHHDELERQVAIKTQKLRKTLHQLQESHDEISARNAEKETLLKEIHHRVKNNMQIVISLLNLSATESESEQQTKVFKEAQSRIRSMAMIHERLYAENDLSRINARLYIRGLCDELLHTFQPPNKVIFQLEVDDISFPIETFMPIGLIINELVVNSLKYAFVDGRLGVLKIHLSGIGNAYTLVVADNGVGLPEGMDVHQQTSIGLELIHTLIEQLGGSLEREKPQTGTAFRIQFEA